MPHTTTHTSGMVTPEQNVEHVRLVKNCLTLDDLQDALRVAAAQTEDTNVGLILDFTAVDELVGPWSLHWALIIHLARQMRKAIRIRGLHGQPLSAAWLYRRAPEIQSLFGIPGPEPEKRAAKASPA